MKLWLKITLYLKGRKITSFLVTPSNDDGYDSNNQLVTLDGKVFTTIDGKEFVLKGV